MGNLFQAVIPLLVTDRSRARLRMTRYRDVDSATMIYDHAPINDVFRRVDEDTVLGLMDLKGMEQPFFFLLRREEALQLQPSEPGRDLPEVPGAAG